MSTPRYRDRPLLARALWRTYRVLWPRYCGCVCHSRFIYSSACSDHNPLDTRFGGFGYANIYTWIYHHTLGPIYFLWWKRRHGLR
jgi:hypothetical protein